VFLHGSGGLRWDEEAFGRLSADYRLIVPSLPGFDRSTLGPVTTGQDVADVVAELVHEVAGGKAFLIGESFGGRIAAWTTIRHPEVVEKAVLAAPGGVRRSGGDRGLHLSPEERQIRLYGRVLDRQRTPDEQTEYRGNLENAVRLGGPPWDEDLYQLLPTISRPVLFLYGTNDQSLAREDIDLYQSRVPGSRIEYLEGAPHVVSFARPEDFSRLVKEFFAG
jgi:pimeloyl-ACP methyl ester carboxylesterase